METNLINDKDLKIKVLDSSCAYLINNQVLTKEELPYLKAEFGYLFQREDGYIEALYKIIKQTGEVMYLALQENKIMMIQFNEDMFYSTIAQMRSLHPCLNQQQ